MVKGDLTLQPDAHVELRGMVRGDVTLEQGAHLLLAGMAGQVVNQGGTVDYPARERRA